MSIKNIANAVLGFFHLPTFMPKSAKVELIAEMSRSNLRISQIMELKNKLALCTYDNDSRHNAWVYVVDKKGGNPSCMHTSSTKETIGMSNSLVKYNGRKVYVMPAEDPKRDGVLCIDYETGSVSALPFKAPYRYAEVADGSVAYFADKGKGGFWDVLTGKQLDKNLPKIAGIVFGMVKRDGEYICATDDGGLMSTKGWKVNDFTPDVNYAGNTLLAFTRDGKVRKVKSKGLGSEIGNTKLRPRRSSQDTTNSLCYWTTHGPQTLWVTNGRKCKKLADFGGDVVADASKEGSCFSSAVVSVDSKTCYVAATKARNSGWRLYKVTIKW